MTNPSYQMSPDGQFYWDGARWVPVQQAPPPPPPPSGQQWGPPPPPAQNWGGPPAPAGDDVDWAQAYAEAGEDRFSGRIPDGQYPAVITEATVDVAQSTGNRMWVVKGKITDGQYAGTPRTIRLTMTPKSLPIVARRLRNLGVPGPADAPQLWPGPQTPPEQREQMYWAIARMITGRPFTMVIGHEQYDPQTNRRITADNPCTPGVTPEIRDTFVDIRAPQQQAAPAPQAAPQPVQGQPPVLGPTVYQRPEPFTPPQQGSWQPSGQQAPPSWQQANPTVSSATNPGTNASGAGYLSPTASGTDVAGSASPAPPAGSPATPGASPAASPAPASAPAPMTSPSDGMAEFTPAGQSNGQQAQAPPAVPGRPPWEQPAAQ